MIGPAGGAEHHIAHGEAAAVAGDHFKMHIEGLGGCSIQFAE